MSAKRVTVFTCDSCGKWKMSPENYELPDGWEHDSPAGEPSTHRCSDCSNNN